MGGRGGASHRTTAPSGGALNLLNDVGAVAHWIQKQNWFCSGSRVSLNGVDLAAAKEIANTYQQVFDRFPQLKGRFEGVYSFNLGAGTYADCQLTNGQIRVSTSMYRSVRTLQSSYAVDVRSNWHPADTDWPSIITHEIGHAIDGYISRKMQRSDRHYHDWYYNASHFQQAVASRLNIPINSASISRETSRHGATTPVEWFAESFAEAMRSPSPRRMAQEFMVELENTLRRIR